MSLVRLKAQCKCTINSPGSSFQRKFIYFQPFFSPRENDPSTSSPGPSRWGGVDVYLKNARFHVRIAFQLQCFGFFCAGHRGQCIHKSTLVALPIAYEKQGILFSLHL